ncbi:MULTISPECIES: DUF6612 family protein [Lysinibacillus]|mgnify:FL=1|uniref:Lipoprotein n=1 Tax=Lysinibacillus fusiformis TaxID=28031 RepID=A0A1H9NGQ6_9BACI|nr:MULTISPECIES: DUF6612 family protein [Lysinibacillus]AJK86923.1 hypothetical protein HR49_06995 [Lysinibacillus fusiformis]KAB0443314.1 hypothetical protein CH314_06675 [Lysinibacillus fusiformis]KEK12839.1 hypothetical protein EP18_02935 [Lysinibacillus sphaericus]KHK56978.1 hypothetical protein PI85_01280 [Lysinibacillus sp. A1]MCE4044766.1 hypothetical protein [Lysinibacillus fusiformis]
MKKIFKVLAVGTLALTLAACNSSATPTKDTTKTSNLTLEQVYDKAVDRQSDIKSASANMDMTQVTKVGSGEEAMEFSINSKMEMDIIVDPLAMHLSGSMSMPDMMSEGQETTDMPIEMYMKKDAGLFMKDVTTDSWLKLPDENFDAILDQTAASADAKEQLEQLKKFINDFTFEQTDKEYVLTLEAKGDKFKELIDSEINKSIEDMGLEENPMDQLTIEKINYVLHIDKETFDTKKMDMNFDLKMAVEGDELLMNTKSVVTYTDFNHLKTIDIPQSIVDNAQTIE